MSNDENDKNDKAPPEKDLSEVQNTPEDSAPPPDPVASGTEDVSIDKALSAAAKKKNPNEDKFTKYIGYGAGGVFVLMIIMMVFSCQPSKGSMPYGICSTFLELNTTYPNTLTYTNYELSRTAVRIYFTNIDAFGEFKQEMLQCTFGPDQDMGIRLTDIERNRIKVDRQVVEKFNLLLPTIMASDPYRVLPPDWKNPLLEEDIPMYETHPLPSFAR